jgi:hypothetical protein
MEENPTNSIFVTPAVLKYFSKIYDTKIQLEAYHNNKNYLKLYKKFDNGTTRNKKVQLTDEEFFFLTTAQLEYHLRQFISPILSF